MKQSVKAIVAVVLLGVAVVVLLPVLRGLLSGFDRERVEQVLHEHWGIRVRLRCESSGSAYTCGGIDTTGKPIKVTIIDVDKGTLRVDGPDGAYVVTEMLRGDLVRRLGEVSLRCKPGAYTVMNVGTSTWCELTRPNKPDALVRYQLWNRELELRGWQLFEAPTARLERLFKDNAVVAAVTCPGFPADASLAVTCQVTAEGITFPVRVEIVGDATHPDIQHVGLVPRTVLYGTQTFPLRCPRKLVRPGDHVTCRFIHAGKDRVIEATVRADGAFPWTDVASP